MVSERVALRLGLLSVAALGGCSLLVHPDETRLARPDGSVADVSETEGGRPDVALDVRVDGGPRVDVVADVRSADAADVVRVDILGADQADVPVVGVDVADARVTCTGDCSDGVSCTIDRCDPVLGCVHTPDNTTCGGSRVCDPVRDCVTGPCRSNLDCSDDNVCNGVEQCLANGSCAPGVALICDDGQFCNGTESCAPTTGCVPGTSPTCDDSNPCTVDACEPAGNRCANLPVDADGDSFPASSVSGAACVGGTDCNDGNGAVRPGVVELCNGIDDNCDGRVDDVPGCTPPNDTCSNATVITLAGGTARVSGTTTNAAGTLDSNCDGNSNGGDVWYSVTYPADQDLRIEADPTTPNADPVLVVRDSCGSNNLVCNDDRREATRGSGIWLRAGTSPFGGGTNRTVLIAVDSFDSTSTGSFELSITTTPAGISAGCPAAHMDLSAGGALYGRINGFGRDNTTRGSCGGNAFGTTEELFDLRVAAGRVDVNLEGAGGGFARYAVYARSGGCADGSMELVCALNNPVSLNYNDPGSGLTTLFVDNLAPGSNYSLTVHPQ